MGMVTTPTRGVTLTGSKAGGIGVTSVTPGALDILSDASCRLTPSETRTFCPSFPSPS